MNERIKQIRRELGLTQAEFAERIGLKQNSIALIESGKRNISDQAVLSICREYGVNEEWLRTGDGDKFIPDSNDELEALAKKYDLSNADQVLIEKYVNLKPGSREAIINFITDVVAGLDGAADLNSKGDVYQRSWSVSSRRWKIRRKAGWVKMHPVLPGPYRISIIFVLSSKSRL